MVSIIIPSRNEPYLKHTVIDLLEKSTGEIEIIVVLDGYWPLADEMIEDPRVVYIHFSDARGMRNAENSAVAVAKGEFIMKLDAHCMLSKGYDEVLKKNCEYDWVVVPRRYALDVENWKIEERSDDKYPIDYMFLDSTLHGRVWTERNHDKDLKDKQLDETMSNQGSIWFMKKAYFEWLELMDESLYGMFWNEFQEIGLKCWLSGGKVMVNKGAWYAHWHKTKSRGYSLPSEEQVNAQKNVDKWLTEKMFHKQKHDIKWLVDRFKPVPTW